MKEDCSEIHKTVPAILKHTLWCSNQWEVDSASSNTLQALVRGAYSACNNALTNATLMGRCWDVVMWKALPACAQCVFLPPALAFPPVLAEFSVLSRARQHDYHVASKVVHMTRAEKVTSSSFCSHETPWDLNGWDRLSDSCQVLVVSSCQVYRYSTVL